VAGGVPGSGDGGVPGSGDGVPSGKHAVEGAGKRMATVIESFDGHAAESASLLSRAIAVNPRILLVDDNANIHEDFRRVLGPKSSTNDELAVLGAGIFGDTEIAPGRRAEFELDSAFQGEEALKKVIASLDAHRPYALAFVDVRMPPGWDGVKTTTEILRTDPNLSVVICSAYSDHSWEEMSAAFGDTDRVLILKKPFDTIEVRQLAHALQRRWQLATLAALKMSDLEALVDIKTRHLQTANERLRHEAEVRARMESELRLAQKLEAVGQLAAGIAHEINTPMQYIVDNLTFLREAYGDITRLLPAYGRAVAALDRVHHDTLEEEIRDIEREVDLPTLARELPRAIHEMTEGVRRVTEIVLSMKEFALPDGKEKMLIDVNKIVRNTLTVARNEYRYVADMSADLADVPLVSCRSSDIGQVILSLVMNAAHAIADVASNGKLGRITVSTARDGEDFVKITVSDTGPGIAEGIRERVFDPFFTTKEVGRGKGQGLAVARAVVDKHGGTLTFDTELGKGTAFHVRLPIVDPDFD
jgi:two-component system NtrC family sensor kinase